MIYLLDGTETYHLSEKKSQLVSGRDVLPENVYQIDGSAKDFSIRNALIACNTVSLFSDQRIVLVRDPSFLNPSGKKTSEKSAKKKKTADDNSDLLERYCQSPCEDADLIFYCFGFDADKRTKEYRTLEKWQEKGRVKHLHYGSPSLKELEKIISDALVKNRIRLDRDARRELDLRINGSATEFYRALDKIFLYGKNDLDVNDIEHLVPVNQEVNVWKLADAFLAGNSTQTFRSVNELTSIAKNTYQSLAMMLVYRLRAVYNVVRCTECGMDDRLISAKTGRKYPDMDRRSAHGRTSHEILCMLGELAELDQGIKNGRINDKEGLEAFLIRNLNQYAGNTRTL